MTNNQRNAPRSRARRRAEQRRLRMIVFGGTAAVVLIAVLAVLLLKPGGGAPDRAVSQPDFLSCEARIREEKPRKGR